MRLSQISKRKKERAWFSSWNPFDYADFAVRLVWCNLKKNWHPHLKVDHLLDYVTHSRPWQTSFVLIKMNQYEASVKMAEFNGRTNDANQLLQQLLEAMRLDCFAFVAKDRASHPACLLFQCCHEQHSRLSVFLSIFRGKIRRILAPESLIDVVYSGRTFWRRCNQRSRSSARIDATINREQK